MVRELSGQGLALSGGGYRASLFHLGVTRRLHELGILHQTTRLSSVSGGSILEHGTDTLSFDHWDRDISAPFRDMVRKDIRTGLVARHIAWNWIWPAPRARGLEKAFRKRLGDRRLVELPKPSANAVEFIFLATNIEKRSYPLQVLF